MNSESRTSLSLAGRVTTGVGQGAGFTQLDWVRKQFLEHCGVDPFPGTLNLTVESDDALSAWRQLRMQTGRRVTAASADMCDAMLHPVRISGAVTGAVVIPEVEGYPANQVEIGAAVDLRRHFAVVDGDVVNLSVLPRHVAKAIIFDVDGTLLNSLDGYRLAASRATAAYGYSVSLDHVRQALNSNQPFWDFVIPPGGTRDENLIAELRAATMRHWPDALEEVVDVIPGCAAALDRLLRAGTRLAIYTGSGGESFPPLRTAGLLDLFEVIVTGNEVQARKPDPDGIRLCLEKLDLAPAEVAYVGDSCIDVAASLAAGVQAVSVLTGAGDCASLSAAGTHRIVTSVARIPEVFLHSGT